MVRPVLEYGAQHWGVFPEVARQLEGVQHLAARWILGCNRNTPLDFLSWELGWEPIRHRTALLALRMIGKMADLPKDRLQGNIFRWLVSEAQNGVSTWWTKAEALLELYDLPTDVGLIKKVASTGHWGDTILKAVRHMTRVETVARLQLLPKLARVYCSLKTKPRMATYLQVTPLYLVRSLAQMRSGTARLRIETGRWLSLPRSERICPLCTASQVEDEVHVLLECERLDDIRQTLIDSVVPILPDLLHVPLQVACSWLLGTDNCEYGLCTEQMAQISVPVARFLFAASARRRRLVGNQW